MITDTMALFQNVFQEYKYTEFMFNRTEYPPARVMYLNRLKYLSKQYDEVLLICEVEYKCGIY